MLRSLQIAQKEKANSIAVTYDLVIAKTTTQIQKEKSLVSGNIFIVLVYLYRNSILQGPR